MGYIKKRMQEGDPKVIFSTRMRKGPYGSRKNWLCLRKKSWRRKSWTKPIRRGTPFILGALRCIMTWVDKNEAWGSSLCFWMWHLLEGQGWLYEAWRADATTKHSKMEVGQYMHGLHCRPTFDGPQILFNLGDRGLTLQICPLYTHSH
jgi:hypothetical protein